MTSPFTTDPAALAPRRVRRDPSIAYASGMSAYQVGCGHAATAGANDVHLVRLADGRAWDLLHTQQVWHGSSVVGLTCDELFVVASIWVDGVVQDATIQRIRLDALGEGSPAD